MLPCLPYDETTISVFLKHQFECKSFYMSKNVCVNLIMLTLKYLISTILYTNLNVTIHFKWTNLFLMHTTLYIQIDGKYMSLFDNSNSKNEKHIDCASIDSMIHNFFNVFKINDYENEIVYLTVPK